MRVFSTGLLLSETQGRLEVVCVIGDIKVFAVSQISHMGGGEQQAGYLETFNSLTSVLMHLVVPIDGTKLGKINIPKSQSYTLELLRFFQTY